MLQFGASLMIVIDDTS